MAKRRYFDFDIPVPYRGEAHIYSRYDFPKNHASLMQNCYITERGTVAKIPGHELINNESVGHDLTTGIQYIQTDGTEILLVAGGGKIYKSTGTTLTAIKTGLDSTAKVYFSVMNDLCIITNGVDAPMKYDGTTVSTLGGTPPASAFKSHVHKGRVWMIERSNKMLATCSDLNNPEDYTGAGASYIDFKYVLKRGDELVDIDTYVDLLVFYFKDHIAIYSGQDPTSSGDFSLVQIISGLGSLGTGAITNVGTDQIFISKTGCKSLRQVVTTGSLNYEDISERIDPVLMKNISGNLSGKYGIAHYPKLSMVLILIDDIIWIYSYVRAAWYRMTDTDALGIFDDRSGNVYILKENYFYKFGKTWAFGGKDIDMRWKTSWISKVKGAYIHPHFVEFENGMGPVNTIEITVQGDQDVVSTENRQEIDTNIIPTLMDTPLVGRIDDCFYMDKSEAEPIRIPIFGRGKTLRFGFRNLSSKGPLEITGGVVQATLGGL